ncbi:MAG: hypothetical protein ACQSGP_09865 [Frankia sp.]
MSDDLIGATTRGRFRTLMTDTIEREVRAAFHDEPRPIPPPK